MQKSILRCVANTLLAMLITMVVPAVQAYQPKNLLVRFNNDCKEGKADDIRGSFNIKNLTQQTVQLDIQPSQGENYSFRYIANQRVLRAGEEATVHFAGNIRADGKYEINASIGMTFQLQNGETFSADHSSPLYIIVQGGRFRSSTYEELYLQPDVIDKEMGNAFLSVGDTNQIKRGEEYKRPMPSVQQMIEMDPKSIYRIPSDSVGPNPCPKDCEDQSHAARTLETFRESDIIRHQQTPLTAAVAARGEFHWKGMDSLLHPAFGWRVKAWQKVLGNWIVVAEDWIQWDGKWTLNIPDITGASETRFQYVAFNRFFTPQTSGGDTYRWVGPLHAALPAAHNEGSWFADTSAGSVRGLGEIYREGMTLWSKLYWEGEINPLRGSSIKVFFPNTTYDCGDGSGDPWSCAARDGRIWLIPSHASRNGVMQHELAHQINYEYWNNDLPSGSGGSHNLVDCYNGGLALIEGFANYMVFWTQSARGSDPSTGFDFRVENPSFACADPLNTNESWVAANFWDLHDTHGDGSDNLWFIHPGATPAIFLREGKKNGMADFHPVYRSRANSEHRTIIDSIFKQDKIIN